MLGWFISHFRKRPVREEMYDEIKDEITGDAARQVKEGTRAVREQVPRPELEQGKQRS